MSDHLLLPDRIALSSRRQGGGTPPRPTRNPRRHGQQLSREVGQVVAVATRIRVVEGVDPGLVFKVRATGRITDETFANRGLTFLGETHDWTYFVFSDEDVPRRLLDQLASYSDAPDEEGAQSPGRSFFNAIEHFEPYGPEDRRTPDLPEDLSSLDAPMVVDVIAWPSANAQQAQRRVDDIRTVVGRFDGEEIASDARAQFTVLRARLSGAGIEAMLGLSVVERIGTPPVPFIEPSDWVVRGVDDLEFEARDGEPLAVVDDGVADGHPLLRNLMASRRAFPETHGWGAFGSHGTMVAGLAAYGDFEAPLRGNATLVGRGPIHQARVLEPDPARPSNHRFAPNVTVHQAIESAIQTLHDEEHVRVFNLSIAQHDAYSGPHVGLLTERLDQLVRELGLVIVVSAGNHAVDPVTLTMANGAQVVGAYPTYTLEETARVAEPAPAALAMVVGSIARSDAPQTLSGIARVGDRAVAAAGELSPFSRTGPGAFKSVKPDVVDYGGNWVVNDSGRLEWQNAGVSVISTCASASGRLFAVSTGTSFAAPRVARLAADVWTAYPDASANLVRALIGIATRVPAAIDAQYPADEQRLRAVGYGRPVSELALGCGGNRVVMYFDGAIQSDTVAIHPVPIPPGFARGRSARSISVALAFDPPVRRQRREYLAGEMTFDLLLNVSPEEVAKRYERQGEDRVDLFTDRRRLDLKPGPTRTVNSTLQVRRVFRKQLDPDDGDIYYLAVKHRPAPWASGGQQPYAVVVEIVDEEQEELDLYAEVQQRVRLPARVRIRP
jgi:hypothetical protein